MPAAREPASGLIHAAELADLVAHEVNNQLNSIVLHVALLERALPAKPEGTRQMALEVIRQAANRAGNMLRRWQQLGTKAAVPLEPLDLNQVLRDLPLPQETSTPSGEAVSVHFQSSSPLPRVLANAEDVRHLVTLLLKNAAKASPARTAIAVRAEPDGAQVLLSVEDQGAEIEADRLERAFEPFAGERGGLFAGSEVEELTLPICKILARRQKATITATRGSAGGLRINVRFTAVASEPPMKNDK